MSAAHEQLGMHLVLLPPVAVLGLLVLVIWLRLHAFLALLVVSLTVGIAANMSATQVLDAAESGMASTVGFIAVIVGLGSMFGSMLDVSGGAQMLARTLIRVIGIRRAPWALALTGFIIGLSVFFSVGFILLVPLIYSLARETGRPILHFALPVVSALAVTHAFLPPHPGPMAVSRILHADIGRTILYGCLAGIPVTILSGVFLSQYLAARVPTNPLRDVASASNETRPPAFGVVLVLVLLPVGLIVANTLTHSFMRGTLADRIFVFLGHPFVALSLGTLLAFWFLGKARGMTALEIQELADRSLKPGGQIILIVGAGGIFKQILSDSGSGQAVAELLSHLGMSPIWLAFTLALLVRVSVGSATVSMMTAAGLVNPMMASFPHLDPSLVSLAIACGATACSHVNDSGFWMVKEYLHLSEAQTLRSWTVTTAVIGFTGVAAVWLLSFYRPGDIEGAADFADRPWLPKPNGGDNRESSRGWSYSLGSSRDWSENSCCVGSCSCGCDSSRWADSSSDCGDSWTDRTGDSLVRDSRPPAGPTRWQRTRRAERELRERPPGASMRLPAGRRRGP